MKLLRLLVVVVVIVGLLLRLLGVALGPTLLWVAGAAEALLLVSVLYGLFRLWRVRRRADEAQAQAQPRGWDALRVVMRESLPEGPAEAVVSEMRMFVAALATLTLRPLRTPQTPGRVRFGSMASSVYGGTVTALVVLLVIEAPAVHLLLGALMDEGLARSVTQAVLLLSSIYLGVWLLGDLRLLKEAPGVIVGDGRLEIELGLRARGEIGLDEIVGVDLDPIDKGDDAGADRDATPILIAPMAAPNCRVWLHRPVTMRGLVGIPMRGDRLDIYVDDPSGLAKALDEHRKDPPQASWA
ncbi:MAG: hypothetical protein K0V04_38400 [Deltaproteobacteria bacterium]|nr:hypothetical protein [Deltaproteobacteria bacterium]